MKILQVGSGLHGWAGIEKYVITLEEALTERGHDVTVSITPGTPLDKALSQRKIPAPLKSKRDLRAVSGFIRLFQSHQFDVVHTHFNPEFLIVALAAKLSSKPMLVMSRHVSLTWPPYKAKLFSRLYDRIIPVSGAVRLRLLASGVPDEKMRVAKAGCPPLHPTEKAFQLDPTVFQVGFLGRIAPEKGIKLLLQAAATTPKGIAFHLFGDGPLKSEVESASALLDNIHFHGFRKDIANCLASLDCVIIPSIWEEAFPYSALEAMSMSLPVIASRIGGLPELVDHNSTGLLFEAANPEGLIDSVTHLASNRPLAMSMGQRGREIHATQYMPTHMALRVESVYQELAQTRPG